MKLAWIVWRFEGDTPEIHFTEPDSWVHKTTPIVYAEILP